MSPPLDYTNQPVSPGARPASLTFIGVLGIIFGVAGVFCLCAGLTSTLMNQGQQTMPQMSNNDMILGIVTSVIGMLLSVMLVIGSVAALGLRFWSRGMLIVLAVVNLIFEIFKLVVAIAHSIPMSIEMIKNPPPGTPADQLQGMQMVLPYAKPLFYGMAILFFSIQAGYSILVLVIMNRPHVKAVLARQGILEATTPPEQNLPSNT